MSNSVQSLQPPKDNLFPSSLTLKASPEQLNSIIGLIVPLIPTLPT